MNSIVINDRAPQATIPPNVLEKSRPHDDRLAELLLRAERILSDSAQPSDYLPVPQEVESVVQAELQEIRQTIGIDAAETFVRLVTNRRTEQFHHGGKNVASMYDSEGVVVFAVGTEQISALLRRVPADHRKNVVIRYVDPWLTDHSPPSA